MCGNHKCFSTDTKQMNPEGLPANPLTPVGPWTLAPASPFSPVTPLLPVKKGDTTQQNEKLAVLSHSNES